MTGAGALLYFTAQVAIVSQQLHVDMPQVRAISEDQRSALSSPLALAYIDPKFWWETEEEISIKWHVLWSADKRMLRCIARHEVAHLALGGGLNWTKEESVRAEASADALIDKLWNEPAQCRYPR